jgi:hypothetical protein
MSHPYSSEHVWATACTVELPTALAKQANRRGTVRIPEATKVEVLDIYCANCRRPIDAVLGKECAAAENRDHLIGGPTGERAKRTHPHHDCEKYNCTLGRDLRPARDRAV